MRAASPMAQLCRRLVGAVFLTSFFYFSASPASAAQPDPASAALQMYFDGRGVQARDALARLASAVPPDDPQARVQLLEPLLDICVQGLDLACVERHARQYVEAVGALDPKLNAVQRLQYARKTLYYLDRIRLATGDEAQARAVIETPAWSAEYTFDIPLYLRRQMTLSDAYLLRGDDAGATRAVDRILSMAASIENPQEGGYWIAVALVDAVASLLHLSDSERAFGVYSAAQDFIRQAIPPRTPDAIRSRLVEARLFQERGDLPRARSALDQAVRTAREIELEPHARSYFLGEALTLRAVVCTSTADRPCARSSITEHPLAAAYRSPHPPADYAEVSYLAARALVAATDRAPDPVAAAALAEPVAFDTPGVPHALVDIYRSAGMALLQPEGAPRRVAMRALGRQIADYAHAQRNSAFGVSYRPGVIDQLLILLSLAQVEDSMDPADQEAAFALVQLANRVGPSFDADAQSILARAGTDAERRKLHSALRLRARRDRLERQELQRLSQLAATAPRKGEPLRRDFARRDRFRAFSQSFVETEPRVPASLANLVSVREVQAVLGADEAAIAIAPAGGDAMAHVCIRQDRVIVRRRPVDPGQLALDLKLVEAALAAGHAPSETLDLQFPVAAAVRLHQALVASVEDCLRAADHLVWLSHPSFVPIPLAVLLETPAARIEGGYDLTQASWLGRRYAVTYGVSAGAFVASRRSPRPQAWAFDFLGVGDPQLEGRTPAGEDRSQIVLRGVRSAQRLADLSELPETRLELEQSAAAFPRSRLLLREQATERGFRRQLVGDYRLLSFATHGLIREEIDGLAEPALAFTPASSTDPLDDGLLTASEIADLNLSARFVALSACNTANYDLTQFAADLPALASAFAVAGTPSVLATLWPVDSDASKTIVAETFASLGRSRVLPAEALAAAQRRYLEHPPTRAHAHPRFWAPFIVLGDAGASAAADVPSAGVRSVEILTDGGGEALALRRFGDRLAVRLIDRKQGERFTASVRLSAGAGEQWRTGDGVTGAAKALFGLGGALLAGGSALGDAQRYAPVLQAYDPRSGALLSTWRGPADDGHFMLAGASQSGDRGYFSAVETDLGGAAGLAPRVRVYAVDERLAPRLLFETRAPTPARVRNVTVTETGGALVVTFSDSSPMSAAAPLTPDEFERYSCLPAPVTWIEKRDLASGRLLVSRVLQGLDVAATTNLSGQVILAGAIQDDCRRGRGAVVAALDAQLKPALWARDGDFGESDARAVAVARGGGVVVAGWKARQVDHLPTGSGEASIQRVVDRTDARLEGWAMRLEGPAAFAPVVIAAGSQVFVSDVEASGPGSVVVAGAVGGEAAVFELDLPPR